MKSVIVGTAGHIDHGKTALVKALTGMDTDRLEEEKRRGITIDLGFAHLDLPGPGGETLQLGFVDVPGHERFIRNMLAGVGGIDLVLPVIAADESIKPQTREHFDICRLLAIRRGIVVLTKPDLVDAETLDVVAMEVRDFLRGASSINSAWGDHGQDWPIVAASSLTGVGIAELKQELARVAAEVPARDSSALARLPIDRVFTMKGFGTVATGTLVSGAISREQELQVFPGGGRVRVRGLEVHGNAEDQVTAGQRTALNLVGVAKEDLARGMVLAPPARLAATSRVDVTLTLLPSAKPLKDRSRVHMHAFTWETVATVALHGGGQMAPGESRPAQLRLADPTLLLPGDRFIIRQFSPVFTIGGGVVLDASPYHRRVRDGETAAFLKIMAEGSPEQVLAARIARRGKLGMNLSDVVKETGWAAERARNLLAKLVEQGKFVLAGDGFVADEVFSRERAGLLRAVTAFHGQNPLVPGIGREALREQLALSPQVFAAATDSLVRERQLDSSGELIRLPGRGVVMKDEEAESRRTIEQAFASAGLKVPMLQEVVTGLKVDKTRAQKIVTLLLREQVLVKISDDLVFHRDALNDLRKRMAAEKTKSAKIDVGRFKDLAGVSRKYAIPLLEYLDREHVTKRIGNDRLIL